MRYSVELTEPAEKSIEESHDWLHAEAPEAAVRWIDGLRGAIESLANFPMRCPLAPESDDHPEDIRQLLYGGYRILFVIRKRTVFVLHLRHASRDRAGMEDLYQG